VGLEAFQILRGFGGKNYIVFHSGHNIARLSSHVKPEGLAFPTGLKREPNAQTKLRALRKFTM
jgi:hypothetical protein